MVKAVGGRGLPRATLELLRAGQREDVGAIGMSDRLVDAGPELGLRLVEKDRRKATMP